MSSNKERKKNLQAEGWCLRCKAHEHPARLCPRWVLEQGQEHEEEYMPKQLSEPGTWLPEPNTQKSNGAWELNLLQSEGRCFHCKRKGHLRQECPAKVSQAAKNQEDEKTVVEELSQTWKPNGHRNVYLTRHGQGGQEESARYICFETVNGEPMVYGLMSSDETIHEEPLRAAPCYNTFPFEAPIEGSYQGILNCHRR